MNKYVKLWLVIFFGLVAWFGPLILALVLDNACFSLLMFLTVPTAVVLYEKWSQAWKS